MFWFFTSSWPRWSCSAGVDLRRLGLGEIGLLLIDRRLVGVLFDAEQKVAGFDLLAFGEIALLDEAGDARDDVDLVDGHDPADEIAGFRHRTADHLTDRDRRRRGALRCSGAAAGDEKQQARGGFPTQYDHSFVPDRLSSQLEPICEIMADIAIGVLFNLTPDCTRQ
jgi:hypothetical protein